MSIGPILSGRLPGSLATRQLQSDIASANQLIYRMQNQVATGQKYFLPSEAPASAIRTMGLQKQLERNVQIQKNINTDLSFLEVSESSLGTVNEALNRAKSYIISGLGAASSPAEKQAMATELSSLITASLNSANATHSGRYLFGGSETGAPPFQTRVDGSVVYNGDEFNINSTIGVGFLEANNVNGNDAFQAFTDPITSDINPALTNQSRVEDFLGGRGVKLGRVQLTLDNGGTPQTATVDLSKAETVADIEALLENAFAGGPLTLDVDIDPSTSSGLRLTPSAGTVSVSDITGSYVARDLGIASAATAQVTGSNLNPAVTLNTELASLNGGAGIGSVSGTGLQIKLGAETATIDLNGLTTVEDLFNAIKGTGLDLDTDINSAGNGIAIRSRRSGADFSIGENGGTNATALGIRTFSASTKLTSLNHNTGVNVDGDVDLQITRRDGTDIEIDLAGTKTVQDVLDAINAVDPGNLVASLNSTGNGISITDNSGTGPFVIPDSSLSVGLGINGTESGTDNTVALVGSDPNPQDTEGTFSILVGIQRALAAGDDIELNRLGAIIDGEIERFTLVRSEIGSRLQSLENEASRLEDHRISLEETLSDEFDTDIAEIITNLQYTQTVLQATLQIAASLQQLNLFNML
ncbi:Flagellar hook-associated protein 3 [Polystyrenella longa]|uniref:Flagellin n=1 Tax=Polystyrenella longa TaxID=2528007 RepID=A0A518CIV1_9PLAN|nr:flagellin [Polystyrenella longa]QDU79141.1 Flagellar hook-associated protein 3 [Polystyrenella longa]